MTRSPGIVRSAKTAKRYFAPVDSDPQKYEYKDPPVFHSETKASLHPTAFKCLKK